MIRNFVPKIILGVILVLLALHFFVSNVNVTREGPWTSPKFSFSLSKDKSASSTPPAIPDHKSGSLGSPPSVVDDLFSSAIIASDVQTPTAEPLAQDHHSEALASETAEPTESAHESLSTATVHEAVPTESAHDSLETASAHHALETASQTATHDASPSEVVDPHEHHGDESKLPCSELPGAEDVVFVIKTGATEVEEKIPVHFSTTLRCYPKSIVFSDFGEDYQGHIIYDAIGNIIDKIKLEHHDFELWRRLKSNGRQTLDPSELSSNDHGNNLGGGGNPDNGGWRLDKFKNIPMVNYTINRYPDAKWFIYTDADTYIMWSNLLKWVQKMDSSKLVYLGSPAVIDDQVFGHGGSGYVISNALMHKTAEAYNEKQAEWDEYAEQHWAGDCVLATLLEKLGAPLSWAYPMIQGGDNNVMDYWESGYNKRLWCYPAISYHHIPPSTVSSLWHFEQEWLDKNSTADHMTHGDVYKQWYLPQLPQERDGWDNMSEDDMSHVETADAWACRDLCQGNSTCMQWAFSDNSCKLHQSTKLGQANGSVHSGWILDRINEKVKKLDKCKEGEWIMPREDTARKIKRRRVALAAANKYR